MTMTVLLQASQDRYMGIGPYSRQTPTKPLEQSIPRWVVAAISSLVSGCQPTKEAMIAACLLACARRRQSFDAPKFEVDDNIRIVPLRKVLK
jgi:hypothetical protein